MREAAGGVDGRRRERRGARAAAVALGVAAALGGAACGGAGHATQEDGRDAALAALVEELLPAVERHSGIEARSTPLIASSDRDRLDGYLLPRFEEQLPREKASALAAAYARFGLIPDTLDLRRMLLELYREQVVGFYDPGSDTLYVLDQVPEEQLELVLVHELVHALQDQHVDLDSIARALEGENDRATAFQAAVEGHATLAMLAWQLGRMTGRDVEPEALAALGERLAALDIEALGQAAGLGAVSRAPRVIREALLFPYVGGLTFTQRVWAAREGRPAPFGPLLPESTEQVIHPERLLDDPPDPPSAVRFSGPPPSGWTEVHADGLGELETRLFLEEHLGDAGRAARAADGWDGDRYRLLEGSGGEALVWATVWDGEREADEFLSAVRAAYAARYGDREAAGRRVVVERRPAAGRAAVLVLDLPAELEADAEWPPAGFDVVPR